MKTLISFLLLFGLVSSLAWADVPGTMTFQGTLTNDAGQPLNETISVTLTLYDAANDGNNLWTETQSVTVNHGFLKVTVGETNPIDANLIDGQTPLYLGVAIGEDEEMTPRQVVSSVPYATRASTVEQVTGDITPNTVSVNGSLVIDETGAWVGSPAGLEGPQGPEGPQGESGAQGPAGPAGPQGETGAQGPAGPAGPQGETGAQGPAGPAGPQGESVAMWSADLGDCPTGGVGLQLGQGDIHYVCNGAQGLQGLPGLAGPQGETGLQGPAGPTGPQGETGAQGPAGPTGPQGETGAQGPAGPTGPQGETGAQGPAGPTGPQGETGAQGPAGPTGPQGETGAQGPAGPMGPEGPAGVAVGFGTNLYTAYDGYIVDDCVLGEVMLFAGTTGMGLKADGTILPISQYSALFSLLGVKFGGNGTTTFALPNLTSQAPDGTTYFICTEGLYPSRL